MGSVGAKQQTPKTLPDELYGYLGERTEGGAERLMDVIAQGIEQAGGFQTADEYNRIHSAENVPFFNPNFNSGNPRYKDNCALVASAVGLYAQGYDAEAMARDTTWRGLDSVFEIDYQNKDNYMLSGGSNITSEFPSIKHKWESSNGDWRDGKQVPYIKTYIEGNEVTVDNPPLTPRGASAASRAIEKKIAGWGNGAVGALSVFWKRGGGAHIVNVVNQNGKAVVYDAQSGVIKRDLKSWLEKHTIAQRSSLVRLDNARVIAEPEIIKKMVKRREKK